MAKKKNKGKQVKFSPKAYLTTRARTLPLHKCWINSNWEEEVFANVIVSRQHVNGKFTFAYYLVDIVEEGLKDSFAVVNETEEALQQILDDPASEFEEVEYDLVHNIVYGGLVFAEEQGARGDKEFSYTQYVLEEDSEDIPFIPIPFGEVNLEEEEPNWEDTAVGLMIAMTDLAYQDTFGETYLLEEFSEERMREDKKVKFNKNPTSPVTNKEHQIVKPFIDRLEHTDLSDRKALNQLKTEIEKEQEVFPEVPQLYDLLYHILNHLKDHDSAYQIIRKGLARFPDHYTARFFYAIDLLDLDKIEEAEELIWGTYDIKDLPVGKDGLDEFNVYLYYTVRCKIHMKKGEYGKAEAYYIFLRDGYTSDPNLLTDIQVDILMEYNQIRRERLEKHYDKTILDIVRDLQLFEKYSVLK